MDFQFSPEQDALRDAVRAFMTDWAERHDARDGLSDADWAELVELGWTGLLVPEADGGLGLGLVDAAVVLEEMGKVAFPGPYLGSAVIAAVATRRLGLDDLGAEIASGARGAVALEESGHGDPVERVRARARRRGAQWRLTGEKPLVLDLPGAAWVLVVARTPEGIGTFRIDRPEAAPIPTIDATRSVGRLVLDETPATPVGPQKTPRPFHRQWGDTRSR